MVIPALDSTIACIWFSECKAVPIQTLGFVSAWYEWILSMPSFRQASCSSNLSNNNFIHLTLETTWRIGLEIAV